MATPASSAATAGSHITTKSFASPTILFRTISQRCTNSNGTRIVRRMPLKTVRDRNGTQLLPISATKRSATKDKFLLPGSHKVHVAASCSLLMTQNWPEHHREALRDASPSETRLGESVTVTSPHDRPQ